jgi:hypothetical protein
MVPSGKWMSLHAVVRRTRQESPPDKKAKRQLTPPFGI